MQSSANNALSRSTHRRISRKTQRGIIKGLAWFIGLVLREVLS